MRKTVGYHEMNSRSNQFLYSISMTACSTILAMGMMPLCLFIYTKMWTDSDAIVLPYNSIGESIESTLSLLTLPFIFPTVTIISVPSSCKVMKKLP